MENDLEKIIIDGGKNIKKRKELFFKIGQQYLLNLKDRELEEKTFEVFQLIIKHEKDWKGDIFIPEYYRMHKNQSVFKDMWYTLRDYFSWCVLYPDEVDNYFQHDKTGKIQVLENPKVRIMDKDNFKQVSKTENGKQIIVNVKKEKTFVIKSGFTLSQKDSILNVCVAGLLAANPNEKKKVEKPAKKSTKKNTELVEDTDMVESPSETQEDKVKTKKSVAKKSVSTESNNKKIEDKTENKPKKKIIKEKIEK